MRPEVHAEMAAVQARHWWFVARRRILAAVIETLDLPPGARVLDAGCGSGGNLALLARYGALQAMEFDAGARQRACALGFGPVLAGSLPADLPFAEGSFDLVCLLDVLEHVADDAAALQRLREVLVPGGRLLVTVPAYAWLWSAHDEAHHHHRRYTAGRIAVLASAAGLAIERLGYFNTLLFPAIALARLAGRALGRHGTSDARVPSAPVNRWLAAVFGIERRVVPRALFPFGTSVLAVLRRPP